MPLRLAVVGAGSVRGTEILRLLDERRLEPAEVRLLGSVRTAGAEAGAGRYAGRIGLVDAAAFAGIDLAFFAGGPGLAGRFADDAVRAGAAVIDCSSRYRLDPSVPLVVPEVNARTLESWRERGIVAVPSAAAIALAVALAPLAEAAGLRRVVVATYHGVAGAGRRAMRRLARQAGLMLQGRGLQRRTTSGRQAFNVIPRVGELAPHGASAYEAAVVEEVRRILAEPALPMLVTAVRVPAFFGVGLAVGVETCRDLSPEEAATALRPAPGVVLHDDPARPYATLADAVGSGATHVGRVRRDPSVEHGLALWLAIDSIGKGAALNAVQVAEMLARDWL